MDVLFLIVLFQIYDDIAVRILSFAVGIDPAVILECRMNDAAFSRIHRFK